MATKFPPGQDMENVSPKDLEEAKTYTKERKAYKDASKIGAEPSYEAGNRLASVFKDMQKARADRKATSADRASRVNVMGDTYKKGGSVSSRADGIAQRGKTRGKMC